MALRVGKRRWKRKGMEKRAKEDMTNPVKDISCHRNLLLSSLPAPFLQSYLALFTDHSPSFNLFCFLTSLPFLLLYFSRLCPSTNNQIPVMPLASLDALQFLDHAGQFLGLDSVQNESGPAAVVPFLKGGGDLWKHKPRIWCCRS